MLALHNINLTLSAKTPLARQVLNDATFTADPGEFVVIIGPNGAGKSTLLNLIAGDLIPDQGQIVIDQQDVTKQRSTTRANLIARVLQDPRQGTIENLTILENMAIAYKRGSIRGLIPFASQQRKEIFREKLATLKLGLENRLDEKVSNLSGGERQALSLIMALLANCKIVLLDEITGALDPSATHQVMEIANNIVREHNLTCIMITHNMRQALEYADSIWVLDQGRLSKKYSGDQIRNLDPATLDQSFA